MAIVNYENLPSENTPLTGGTTGNLMIMQENGTTHGTDTKLSYSQSFLNDHIVNVSNEVDEDYRVNLLKSKNLFDKNIAINNYGFPNLTDGTITYSASNWKYVYIPCKPNTKYTLSGISSESTGTGITMYNGNTFLSSATTYKNGTFTTASTATKLCVGCRDTELNTLQLEEGETATTYEAFIPNQIVVDDIKYTDTLNVGSVVDNRSRVNVLKSKNLLDLQFLQLLTNSSGTVTTNISAYDVILDTRNISSIYVSGDFTLLDSGTLRIGKYSTYPVVGSTGTRTGLTSSGSIDTSSSNYILLSFIPYNPDNFANNVKASFMINEGSTALPYEPYITPSIYVDNEEIYSKEDTQAIQSIDGYATYWKVGDMVFCNILSSTSTPTQGVLAIIPDELRPIRRIQIRVFYYNGSAYVNGQLIADRDTKKIYIYDAYGNVPSTAQYISGQLFWKIG